MAKNEFTNKWLIAYMAKTKDMRKRKAQDPYYEKLIAGPTDTKITGMKDIPDPGHESTLQRKVQDYCEENGWPCFHDRSKKVNEPGWPDCLIFLPGGKVVLIELKSSAGKLRKEQYALRRLLGWNDHMVYIARSFKRVVEIIEKERWYPW
ncbi:MAG TPA: hypothetical protein ENH07_10305 [Nitrospirae bacterium]|nr:hypothetical protein [Nitrospirota bacterium]